MPDPTAFIAVLNTLAPVFLIVLLGAILRRRGFLDEPFSSSLNKLVFWVALPCLLFTTISSSTFDRSSLSTSAVLMLATLAIATVAWYGAPWLGIAPASRGSFTQSVFRSNNAYVGLPVITVAYAGLPQLTAVKSLAMLTLVPCLILYNVLAVFVLTPVDPRAHKRTIAWRKIAVGILTNPLILACVAGGVAMGVGFTPPKSIAGTLNSLGALAGPGALLALGASLTPERMHAALRPAHAAAFLKLVICPLFGWLLALAFGLNHDARFITLIYLASPTAVASFVMAQAMKGDAVLAGGAVAVSTVYSVLALAIVLLVAGPATARSGTASVVERGPQPPPTTKRSLIVVSIPPQQGIVRHLAGELVAVETLIAANQNPHTYEPTPRQLVRIADAQVLFTAGLPFEKSLLPRLAKSHPGVRVVDPTAGYPVLTIEGDAHNHGHDEEHGHDCAPGAPDPHLWLAPAGILHQAKALAAELAQRDPGNAETYQAGLVRLTAAVDQLDRRLRAQFAPHRGQAFLVYHPAWGHFAHAYGLRQIAIEQHGGSPNAKYLTGLLDDAHRTGIRGILAQSQAETTRVRALFTDPALRILTVHPLEADPLRSLETTAAAILAALPPPATPTP